MFSLLKFPRATGYVAVLLGLACCPIARGQVSTQRALSAADTTSLRTALDAYDAGQFKVAEPVLHRLAAKYPRNYFVNEALGGLYAETQDPARALPYLQQAVRVSTQQALAHANLGAAYLKLSRATEAIGELQTATRLDPANFATQSNLGHALLLGNQPQQAAEAFESAEKIQPNDPDALYNWALSLDLARSPKAAAAVLERLPPGATTAESASLAAELAEQLGDYKSAVLDYQAAVRLDPTAQNIYALDLELLHHWTWDEALSVARFGQAHFPQDRRFPTAAGIALFADGKYALAAAEFARLLHLEPNSASYADLLGRSCEAAADDAATSCQGLEAFALAHPENARIAVFVAARILHNPIDQQDTARAEALLRQATLADPHLPEAFYQTGVLAQQRSQWQESQTALEKAVQLRPDYAEAHFRLSRAYAHLGRREDAQREIALQQQYSQQEKDHLNARMQEVVRFLLKPS